MSASDPEDKLGRGKEDGQVGDVDDRGD